MIPLINRREELALPSIFTINDLGVEAIPKDDGGLLDFLYSLIDFQILYYLGDSVDLDMIKDVLPYYLTANFLRFGIPSDDTILQKLYNYVYYEIVYPLFLKNYITDPNIPNDYNTRSVVTQSSKSYAVNESKIFLNLLKNSFDYVTSISSNANIDSNQYLRTINENPTISRYQAIKKTLNKGELPYFSKIPNMNFKQYIQNSIAYVDTAGEFESVIYANAINGIWKPKPYGVKTWVWSGKKKTRHRGMEGVTVNVNDPFTVVNEMTGETAQLMFPRDYARDITGANTVNCGCDVLFMEADLIG